MRRKNVSAIRGVVFSDDEDENDVLASTLASARVPRPPRKRRRPPRPTPNGAVIEVTSSDSEAEHPPPPPAKASIWVRDGGTKCSIFGIEAQRNTRMDCGTVNDGIGRMIRSVRTTTGNTEIFGWTSWATRGAVEKYFAEGSEDTRWERIEQTRELLGLGNRNWLDRTRRGAILDPDRGVAMAIVNLRDLHYCTVQICGRGRRGYRATVYDSMRTARGSYGLQEVNRFVLMLVNIGFLPSNVPVLVDQAFPQQPGDWECGAYARAAMQTLIFSIPQNNGAGGIDPRIMRHMEFMHLPRDEPDDF